MFHLLIISLSETSPRSIDSTLYNQNKTNEKEQTDIDVNNSQIWTLQHEPIDHNTPVTTDVIQPAVQLRDVNRRVYLTSDLIGLTKTDWKHVYACSSFIQTILPPLSQVLSHMHALVWRHRTWAKWDRQLEFCKL